MKRDELEEQLGELWDVGHRQMRQLELYAAIKTFRRILKVDARNSAALNRMAVCYVKMGKFRLATKYFKLAKKYDDYGDRGSASVRHNLALIYYEREKYTNSLKNFLEALEIEPNLAARHVAVAKVYEQLGNSTEVLSHIEQAFKLEDNKDTRYLLTEAIKQHKKGLKLSDEIFNALTSNKGPFQYELVDEFNFSLKKLELISSELTKLLASLKNKKLSRRSQNAVNLIVIYIHDLNSCILLLKDNYSHSSLSLARDMFEVFLKLRYGLSFATSRGFAEFDLDVAQKALGVTKRRLTKATPGSEAHKTLSKKEKALKQSIAGIKNTYRGIDANISTSLALVAAELDRASSSGTQIIDLYQELYERGSDATHANRQFINKAIAESGSLHGGIFKDSVEITRKLIKISRLMSDDILLLKDFSEKATKKYARFTKQIFRH